MSYLYPLTLLLPMKQLGRPGNTRCLGCGRRITKLVEDMRKLSVIPLVREVSAQTLKTVGDTFMVVMEKAGPGEADLLMYEGMGLMETDFRILDQLAMELAEALRAYESMDEIRSVQFEMIRLYEETELNKVDLVRTAEGLWRLRMDPLFVGDGEW